MTTRRRMAIAAAVVAVVVLVVPVGVLSVFLNRGISARAEPFAIEELVARRLRHLATPREARELPNPVSRTDEVLTSGREHWADHCAGCHGNDGRGDTAIGRGLYPKAPDMRAENTQKLSDGELFYIIENGIRFTGMPAWGTGDPAPTSESWHLVHFISHLPELTAQEVDEMERLNPKSRAELEDEAETRAFLGGEDEAAPRPSTGHHAH